MTYFWALVNIVSFTVQGIALKRVRTVSWLEHLWATAILTLTAGLPLFGWTILCSGGIDSYTLLWGSLFGLLFAASTSCYSYALKIGPLAHSAFLFSTSMLIPTLASVWLWGEALTLSSVIAIALLLVAFYLIVGQSGRGIQRKGSRRWLLLCICSLIASGTASLAIKCHQLATVGQDSISVVGFGLVVAGLSCTLLGALLGRGRTMVSTDFLKCNWHTLLLAAGTTALGNIVYGYLSSRMVGPYLFPVIAGGNLLLTTLASVLLFKERLSHSSMVGIGLGLLAVFILNLP